MGKPEEEWTPIVSIATHWPGNGPDAILCEMNLDSTAYKFEGPHKGEHRVTLDETIATAQLFAAAPDLLAACEAVERAWPDGGSFNPPWMDAVRAALAKARGT
jgi:hypothetical protein